MAQEDKKWWSRETEEALGALVDTISDDLKFKMRLDPVQMDAVTREIYDALDAAVDEIATSVIETYSDVYGDDD